MVEGTHSPAKGANTLIFSENTLQFSNTTSNFSHMVLGQEG